MTDTPGGARRGSVLDVVTNGLEELMENPDGRQTKRGNKMKDLTREKDNHTTYTQTCMDLKKCKKFLRSKKHHIKFAVDWEKQQERRDQKAMEAMWAQQRKRAAKSHTALLGALALGGLSDQEVEKRIKKVFKEVDSDHNEHLDAEEVQRALKKFGVYMSDEEVYEFMLEFDEDGNGEIEFEEWKHLIFKLIDRFGA